MFSRKLDIECLSSDIFIELVNTKNIRVSKFKIYLQCFVYPRIDHEELEAGV